MADDLDDLVHAFKRIGIPFKHDEYGTFDYVEIDGQNVDDEDQAGLAIFLFDKAGKFIKVDIY